MRARIVILIVLAALGATACGSSSKTAAPSGTTTPAGSDSSGATTTTAASGGGGGGGGDFCDLLRKEADAFSAQDLLTTKSAEDIKKIYENVESQLDDSVSKAPDAIKSDLSTLNASIKKLVDAPKKADYDFTKLTPDSFKGLEDPKFEAVSQNIDKYLTQTCHITTTT